MSKNILLEEIKTQLEKIENVIDSGQLDERRRTQIADHDEELKDLKIKIETGNFEEDDLREKLNNLKSSLKTI